MENSSDLLPSELEKSKRKHGFQDPETLKKARERSVRTRAIKRGQVADVENLDFFDVTNGLTPKGFRPTNAMLKVLQHAVSLDTPTSRRSWFKAAGYSRNLWYQWKKIPGFLEWWDAATRVAFQDYEQEWIKIGLKRMQGNTRDSYYYWKEVGEKIFKYISTIAVKTEKSPEEKALTEELLKLFKNQNKIAEAKEIHVEVIEEDQSKVIDVSALELLEKEFELSSLEPKESNESTGS